MKSLLETVSSSTSTRQQVALQIRLGGLLPAFQRSEGRLDYTPASEAALLTAGGPVLECDPRGPAGARLLSPHTSRTQCSCLACQLLQAISPS